MSAQTTPLNAADARVLLTPPAHHEIVIARVVQAPRELVFDAWTQPQHLANWWGPHGFMAMHCEVDLRVGGRFRLDLRGPDGNDYPCEGVYQEIDRPACIVYTGSASEGHPCGSGIPPHSRVSIRFAEHGAGQTRIVINAQLPSQALCNAVVEGGFTRGWSEALERLGEALAAH